jgi:hypothetical protein
MSFSRIACFVVALFFLFASPALAWDSSGHRVIAQIAYNNLTPTAKNKVDQLTELLDQKYPARSRFLFASTWPDQIKNDGVTAFNNWHFINYPFSVDGTATKPPQEENVVWAIQQSEKVLTSTKANPYEKAIFLRYLIHFVGDAHQPLHCAELYSKEFPVGDASGNLYMIKDVYVQNLHAFWDQGVGSFRQYGNNYPLTNKDAGKLADKIQQAYPQSFFANQATDLNPQAWAQQSFAIAKSFVYSAPENSKPSDSYVQQGQQKVEQQLALAGYRLANLLNQIFSS